MIEINKVSAVIFDMDGLIVDSEPLWHIAEKEIFSSVGLHLSTEECLLTTGLPTSAVFDFWFKRRPWLGKSKEELEAKLFELVFGLIKDKATPMLGVIEILEYFKAMGMKIGLASASPLELIHIVVNKLEIASYFECVHSALLEKNNKPHPDVYWTVAKKLGCEIGNCLILEDSINGVNGAVASGAQVIAVPDKYFYGYKEYEIANMKLGSLIEVKDYLEKNKK